MTRPATAGTPGRVRPGDWTAGPAFLIGHRIMLSLAIRLLPPGR